MRKHKCVFLKRFLKVDSQPSCPRWASVQRLAIKHGKNVWGLIFQTVI